MHMMAAAPVRVTGAAAAGLHESSESAAAQPLRHCATDPIVCLAELFETDGFGWSARCRTLTVERALGSVAFKYRRDEAVGDLRVSAQTAQRLHRCALAAEWERIAQRWS
jgi:hypothetical protein